MSRRKAAGLLALVLMLHACATAVYDGPPRPDKELARVRLMPPLLLSAMDDRKVTHQMMKVLPGRHVFLLYFVTNTIESSDEFITTKMYHTTAFAVAFTLAAGRDYVVSKHPAEAMPGFEARLHERGAGALTLRQYAYIPDGSEPAVYTAKDVADGAT